MIRAGRGRRPADDRGAGTVLALALVGAVAALALAAVALGSGLTARQRIVDAADAAALAAADAASGAVPGIPCEVAARVAETDGGRLGACAVEGAIAEVTVTGTALGVSLTARARAGPPPDPGGVGDP